MNVLITIQILAPVRLRGAWFHFSAKSGNCLFEFERVDVACSLKTYKKYHTILQ